MKDTGDARDTRDAGDSGDQLNGGSRAKHRGQPGGGRSRHGKHALHAGRRP
jgi:hypothetical protein